MNKEDKIKVGISIGDPNGIGAEIILKTFKDKMMLDFCTPILFGSIKTLSFIKKQLDIDINLYGINAFAKAVDSKINVLSINEPNFQVELGQPTSESGTYAIKSFKIATQALKEGQIDLLVTAPIDKSNIQSDTFDFPGHTDYLAKELEGDSMMLMVYQDLRIGLLTDHIPVKEVAKAITPEVIKKKVSTLYASLRQDFRIEKPKIALLGINPHIGDNGVIGDDDDNIMIPTIEKMRNEGMIVYGPYAADSFFGSGNYKNFDGIIAAYHDQGLIPFKTLAFGNGVNYTAGLDKVRTSPDHGTAFDIAGKNTADHTSFREAVFQGIAILKNRREFKNLTENVLQMQTRKAHAKSQ